jgi:glycosyltransferase involved in cell wall biosynthesis
MRVALVNITGGGLSGGYRKYLQRVVPLLKADRRISQLSVFLPPGPLAREIDADFLTWPRQDAFTGFRCLRARLRETAPDVVFIPTARWLDCGKTPVVVMVQNMEPLLVPFGGNPFATKVKNLARAFAARRACRRATRVIAISEHVRDFLTQRWRIEAERVGVVPHGADEELRSEEIVRPRTVQTTAGGFVFTAGSIRPARGLRDLVDAVARAQQKGLALDVVVGGAPDPDTRSHAAELRQVAARMGVAERFCWAGQLSAGEMAWCFSNCRAFVMTSRVEACPNIVLEALRYGCISVSTDQAPMPEFFGGAAYYYEARNGRALAERLMEALAAPESVQRARREAATDRAGRYAWKNTADRTVEELELAMGRVGEAG